MLNTLFRSNPFALMSEMDRLFDSFVPTTSGEWANGASMRTWAPSVNVWEDEQALHVEAELPGVSAESLEVFVADNVLTIKGERTFSVPDEARSVRRERAAGAFERSLPLPEGVDGQHIEASLNQGVLAITLPKLESARPRRIEIRSLPAA